jgi:hypothetical protein
MVCLRNISVDTLHKGDTEDNNNNNNNNSNNNMARRDLVRRQRQQCHLLLSKEVMLRSKS